MRAAWTAFVIASLFFLFEFVTRVEPSLAAAQITASYGLTNASFGTLASLYFWIYAPMQIVVGLALDRYGAKKFIVLGSFCCAAGVTAFALTASPILGGAARMLTGFGASFAFVAALWLVNHWFAPQRFALLSGIVNAVGMLGTAIGASALSAAIAQNGWHDVFIATGIVGFVLFAAALVFLREPPSPAQTANTPPAAHIRDSLAAVLTRPRIWIIGILGMLFYMPVNVYAGLWGHSALMTTNGLSETGAGTAISMVFWGMAAGSIAGGYISDALGNRKWVVVVGAVLTALAYIAVLYGYVSGLTAISATLFLAGFFGGFQMLTFAMAKEGLDNALVGTAVAFVNMLGIAGALVFQPLIGYLVDLNHGNYRVAMSAIPICLGLAALIAAVLGEYRHPDHKPGARDAASDHDAAHAAA